MVAEKGMQEMGRKTMLHAISGFWMITARS